VVASGLRSPGLRRWARVGLVLSLLATLGAVPTQAQEPRPARLVGTSVSDPDGAVLSFSWRFMPGEGQGWEALDLDDSQWLPVQPEMAAGQLPAGGWPGVGWFRRHVLVEPALRGRTLALRFASPGTADIYLDGVRVLSTGRGGAPPEMPSQRREACLVAFEGQKHVLAVRYTYPVEKVKRGETIGFHLSLNDPALTAVAAASERPWLAALCGAFVAIPLLLGALHLAFFFFDPHERGNLFYSLEMGTFGVILLREYRAILLATDAQKDLLNRIGLGAPVAAILFGLLVYYSIRTNPFPRSWRVLVGMGLLLFPLNYLFETAGAHAWEIYFIAIAVEIVRIEWSQRTVHRRQSRFFGVSFGILAFTLVLQILVNNDLIPPVAGFRGYYMFGILALAIGMSLSLAYELSRSRLVAAENRRKADELARARDLQLSMLPRGFPVVSGLELAAASQTAAEVGGDYYDMRTADDGALLLAFGDATGHGLAAGIVVTAAKALFASLPAQGSLPDLLASCDDVLRRMRLRGLQMCLALARVTPREVVMVSAAMPPMLIHRARTNTVEELGVGDLPLGGRIAPRFEERRTELSPGDTLLFASDGFAELCGQDGTELGYPRAAGAFGETAGAASAREVVERLAAVAENFRGERPQEDDVTFVVVRVSAIDLTREEKSSENRRAQLGLVRT
jgi:serine phosphatase RsbU (regulator of sigma subunit)